MGWLTTQLRQLNDRADEQDRFVAAAQHVPPPTRALVSADLGFSDHLYGLWALSPVLTPDEFRTLYARVNGTPEPTVARMSLTSMYAALQSFAENYLLRDELLADEVRGA
jgi:hypothetical protein